MDVGYGVPGQIDHEFHIWLTVGDRLSFGDVLWDCHDVSVKVLTRLTNDGVGQSAPTEAEQAIREQATIASTGPSSKSIITGGVALRIY
jgi:hypothetical protein